MRRLLIGKRRSCQLIFNSKRDAGPELTLRWRKGDMRSVAVDRLRAIPADPKAGRAPREAMLPQFEGLDDRIPLYHRELLINAAANHAIVFERIQLPDGEASTAEARKHLRRRWKPSSPLWRAANAVIAHWEDRGIDPRHGHLHGRGIDLPKTPYFAGFDLRYLRNIPYCLTEHGGIEWLEVVHPTRARLLDCLWILPGENRTFLQTADL